MQALAEAQQRAEAAAAEIADWAKRKHAMELEQAELTASIKVNSAPLHMRHAAARRTLSMPAQELSRTSNAVDAVVGPTGPANILTCRWMQAQREEASQMRGRLQAEMDAALAAQQERAAAWQARLEAEDAGLTDLATRLQA